MDGTWKYPEWGNPVTKEHTHYALIGKWILSQKFRILKIQFTDHMKLKKKENQSMDASVLLRRVNKILTGGNLETKCGAETEGKAIQRLPHLGIHPIYNEHRQTQLWIPRNSCWQEADIAGSWEALPEPDIYGGRCLQPNIELIIGSPMEKLERRLKELKGFATP